jgi:hypothetical protein
MHGQTLGALIGGSIVVAFLLGVAFMYWYIEGGKS